MDLEGSIFAAPAVGNRVTTVFRAIRIAGGLPGQAENHPGRSVIGQAQGGEIFVSNVVRELVEGKEYLFGERGQADLKGFDEAVRLLEVQWEDAD